MWVIEVHKQTPVHDPCSGMKLSKSWVQDGTLSLGSGASEETGSRSSIDGVAEGIQLIEGNVPSARKDIGGELTPVCGGVKLGVCR